MRPIISAFNVKFVKYNVLYNANLILTLHYIKKKNAYPICGRIRFRWVSSFFTFHL